jgi:hypothetical protein
MSQHTQRSTRDTHATDDVCGFRFAPCLPETERIVGLGFRYWMLGRQTGDIALWERAWDLYCGRLGVVDARRAISALSHWVGALDRAACREIELFPEPCVGFCRDECLAVSLIASCQYGTYAAAHACAAALVGSATLDQVLLHAQVFADTMTELQQHLSPDIAVSTSDISGLTLASAN